MRKLYLILMLASSILTACQGNLQTKLKSSLDSVSYAVGIYEGDALASRLKSSKLTLNKAAYFEAVGQVLDDKDDRMSLEQATSIIIDYLSEREKKELEENLKKGAAFMKANAMKKGVHTTASGLQYQVIKEGVGTNRLSPNTDDLFEMNYTLTLIDGTKVEHEDLTKFSVDHMISGCIEGLQLMKEGDIYKFFIPQDLAYGEKGTEAIAPGASLIMEIELLKVLPKDESDESSDESDENEIPEDQSSEDEY